MLEIFNKLFQTKSLEKAASDTIVVPERKNAGIQSIFGPSRIERKRSYKITAERLSNMAATDIVIWSILKTRRDQVTQTKWDIVPDLDLEFADLDRWEQILASNINPYGITQEFDPSILRKSMIDKINQQVKKLELDKEVDVDDKVELAEKQNAVKFLFETAKQSMTQEADIHKNIVKKFLEHPNTTQSSFESFLKLIVDDILKFDAGVIIKNKNKKGEIAELYTLPGQEVKVLLNEDGSSPAVPDPAYKYMPSGTTSDGIDFTNDELIYICDNPQQSGYGISPLEVAIWIITASLYAENYNMDYLKHSNVPPGIINLGDIDPENRDIFKKMWDAEIHGAGGLHRMMFVAGSNKVEMVPMKNLSNRDMQLMEYLKWTVSIKCMAYGISPQDIGFTQDFHRTTAETQKEITKSRSLKNLLSLLCSYINAEIVKDCWDFKDIKFTWLDVDLEDAQQRATIDNIDLKNGVISINERREARGEKPIVGGDEHYMVGITQIIDVEGIYKEKQDALQSGEEEKPQETIGGGKGGDSQNPPKEEDQEEDQSDKEEEEKAVSIPVAGLGLDRQNLQSNMAIAAPINRDKKIKKGGPGSGRHPEGKDKVSDALRTAAQMRASGKNMHAPIKLLINGKEHSVHRSSAAALQEVIQNSNIKSSDKIDYKELTGSEAERYMNTWYGSNKSYNPEETISLLDKLEKRINKILSE